MSIFDEVMENDNSVFKNQNVFSIDYAPESIQCRDKELKSILINIKPLLNNNKVLNTILMGNSSTGKTTVIKYALREIEEHTNIKTGYINCNIPDTVRKCYYQLYSRLFELKPHNNLSTEILEEAILEKLEEGSFILVIDDINQLSKKDANRLINELFRANEYYHLNMAIILVINNILFKYSLEKNTQTMLQCQEIMFHDYTEEEIYSILKYRCDLGFKKGVIEEEQIEKISQNVARYTSLRRGLTILNLLGQKIESENRDTITDEDINEFLVFS